MARWICWNCIDTATMTAGKTFEADEPLCSCGVDGKNPRHMSLIVECCTVHFDPPDPVIKGRGKNIFACNRQPAITTPFECFSGEYAAVNCKQCLATEECKAAKKSGRRYVPTEGDFVYCKSC